MNQNNRKNNGKFNEHPRKGSNNKEKDDNGVNMNGRQHSKAVHQLASP